MPSLMKMLYIGVRRSYFCLCFHNEENEEMKKMKFGELQVVQDHRSCWFIL